MGIKNGKFFNANAINRSHLKANSKRVCIHFPNGKQDVCQMKGGQK